jgi:hypothetical protein
VERRRQEEKDWQSRWFKPQVPRDEQLWRTQKDDSLTMRLTKSFVNKRVYDEKIRWREAARQREEKHQAKEQEQARRAVARSAAARAKARAVSRLAAVNCPKSDSREAMRAIRISQRFPTPISTVRKLVLRTVTCALVQTLAIVLAEGHRGASTEADLVLDAIYENRR